MKQRLLNILRDENIDITKYNIDMLYNAGILNIIDNLDFYYDKPYSCESVIKELFTRGVISQIKKTQSIYK